MKQNGKKPYAYIDGMMHAHTIFLIAALMKSVEVPMQSDLLHTDRSTKHILFLNTVV